jgi:hypothetical protein
MTIKHLFPTTKPTVDFNFAAARQLDPRVTFTRSSTGTYVDEDGILQYAAENEPRFDHDPVTGESLGLLVEESRTNILDQSNDFTGWSKLGVTIDPNVVTSPDGTLTATKMQWSGSGRNAVYVQKTTPINLTYSCSFFAKAAEWNFAAVAIQTPGGGTPRYWATFDLTTGDVEEYSASSPTETSYKIDKLSNGWWRVSVTANVNFDGKTQVQMEAGMSPNNTFGSTVSGTPDGTSGIYIWGAQLEAGAFPTSYIPTSGAPVDRSADVADVTGTNFSSWWNSSEGSIVTVAHNFPIGKGSRKAWEFNDNSHRPSGPTLEVSTGAFQSPVAGSYTNSQINFGSIKTKTAFTFTTNGFIAGSGDGSDTQTNTSGLDPNVVRVYIGSGRGHIELLNGTIALLAYYPRKLSNEQLQALTS